MGSSLITPSAAGVETKLYAETLTSDLTTKTISGLSGSYYKKIKIYIFGNQTLANNANALTITADSALAISTDDTGAVRDAASVYSVTGLGLFAQTPLPFNAEITLTQFSASKQVANILAAGYLCSGASAYQGVALGSVVNIACSGYITEIVISTTNSTLLIGTKILVTGFKE